MKLVREHISESIKHLTPRTQEEIQASMKADAYKQSLIYKLMKTTYKDDYEWWSSEAWLNTLTIKQLKDHIRAWNTFKKK